jgi:predicted RNA-binding protein with PUA-like domain
MNNWLFTCNPKQWRIYDFFADGLTSVGWRTVNHRDAIRSGDRVLLWLSGPGGGVVALGEVECEPVLTSAAEDEDKYWVKQPDPTKKWWSTGLRFSRSFIGEPVSRTELSADPVFKENLVIRMPRTANPIPVTGQQWDAVLKLVDRN